MTINATEVNKIFRLATTIDLSAFDTLIIKFTDPTGLVTTLTNPRVSAPSGDVTDPIIGIIPGNTYMQISTIATDFPIPGLWTACGTYTDISPSTFFGEDGTFTIGEAC